MASKHWSTTRLKATTTWSTACSNRRCWFQAPARTSSRSRLLGPGTMGGVLAIHYAGQVTQAKRNVSYQKADDSWIDHEPNRVAHAEASTAPVSPSPTPQAAA